MNANKTLCVDFAQGEKYILCCESYPFLHKSFFFSIQKINIFFIRNCKWELKLWRNMNI